MGDILFDVWRLVPLGSSTELDIRSMITRIVALLCKSTIDFRGRNNSDHSLMLIVVHWQYGLDSSSGSIE